MKILTRKKQGEIYNMLAQARCTTFKIYVETANEANLINHINKELVEKTNEIARIIGGIDGEIETARIAMRKNGVV